MNCEFREWTVLDKIHKRRNNLYNWKCWWDTSSIIIGVKYLLLGLPVNGDTSSPILVYICYIGRTQVRGWIGDEA